MKKYIYIDYYELKDVRKYYNMPPILPVGVDNSILRKT